MARFGKADAAPAASADTITTVGTVARVEIGQTEHRFETVKTTTHLARGIPATSSGVARTYIMAPFHDVMLCWRVGETIVADTALREFCDKHNLPIDWA